MTREEIEKAAINKLLYTDEECTDSNYVLGKNVGFKRGFITGAQWRINSVWHDGSERPKIERKLLTYLESNCCEIDYLCKEDFDWEYYADIRGIVRWAYIDDLLPDGKEEAE